MSTLLQIQNACKSFGPKNLFQDASFAVNANEHIGVIGPNGAGKTTLFKVLTEQESLDDGDLIKAKVLRLGYLAQHDNWTDGQSVEDYLSQDIIQTPLWKLKSLAKNLGITMEMFEKPIASLSGGYRMRCKLLYLIGQEPNLMLLDEPTNYLDLETTLVLENFLQNYEGAFLLISHDREFLRRTTDHIVEVEQGEITKYNGNIDDYFEQKALLRSQLEAQALSQQQKKQQVLDFVARFGAKATKAKQAQSRLKSLDRMETIDLKELPVGASIKIPPPLHAGKIITQIQNANLGYGEKVILKNVNVILNNGDHLAVVGLNGAGKSTFLKTLAQALKPITGTVDLGYQVSIGYYAQHVAESLNANSTVIEEMMAKAHPSVIPQDGLNMAGSLLFPGDDVRKKISVLSGGEKSRVALGQILLQKSPCLVLDEPTNHLDFQTVEALTQALVAYQGTVVVVSHDRSFIRRVGKKILEVNHGQVNVYPGTYEDYVWSLEKGILSEREAPVQKDKPQKTNTPSAESSNKDQQNRQQFKELRKKLESNLRQHEKSIGSLDKKMATLQLKLTELNEKITNTTGPDLNKLVNEFVAVQKEFSDMESQWLEASEQKESTEKQLKEL